MDTENSVLPKALVKSLKDERKVLAGEVKEAKKQMQQRRKASKQGALFEDAETAAEAADDEAIGLEKWERIEAIDQQLERHAVLDAELKKLNANIREVEKQKDEMIAAALAKITEDEAKTLILERFRNLLTEQFEGYLRQYQRSFIAAVENLWQKYAVTTKQIQELALRLLEAVTFTATMESRSFAAKMLQMPDFCWKTQPSSTRRHTKG